MTVCPQHRGSQLPTALSGYSPAREAHLRAILSQKDMLFPGGRGGGP